MSTEQIEGYTSAPAAADFSDGTKQYRGAVMNAAGQIALAGAGAKIDGILKNEPKLGEPARIEFFNGIHKARAGAAIVAGAELAMDANGQFITAAGAGTHIVAKAVNAASAAGVIFKAHFYGYRGVIAA